MTYFNEFCFDYREIDFHLDIEQRRKIFMSLQNGVQVKNSDWLKNNTECGLVNFMSEYNYETKMKDPENGVFVYSSKTPDQYYVQWIIRYYCLFRDVKSLNSGELDLEQFDGQVASHFVKKDTDYKKMCESNTSYLNDTESISEFNEAFETYHAFLNSDACVGIKFNPTQLFALFQYVCSHLDSIQNVKFHHIKVFTQDGNKKPYKQMWENSITQQRVEYYNECVKQLYSIVDTVPHDIFTTKIGTTLKHNVWTHWFADETWALCPCGANINVNDHHCGHIKARAKGGATIVKNLRPICASCNLSMRTRDMNEYFLEMGYTI